MVRNLGMTGNQIDREDYFPPCFFCDCLYYLYCYILLLLGVAEIRTNLWVVLLFFHKSTHIICGWSAF